MKLPRSALKLPRYVERKPLMGGWGYFFHVPSWARKAGCTVQSGPLGTDYSAAVSRAETILLPAFDAWRTGSAASASSPAIVASGTLDWMFGEYRADRRFTKLDPSRKVKEVIRAARLRDELSFTSFRHGGFTEGGDAELTDREMLAQGRHTTVKVLPKYTKRTTRQIMNGAKKRRASRTKDGHLSE